MKVLLISPLPPPCGGIGTWTKKYLENCQEYGIETDIVNTALIGKINTKRSIKDEYVRTRQIFRSLKKHLNDGIYDVVHLNTSCGKFGLYRDYLLCCRVKKKQRILVVHFRCNLSPRVNTRIRRFIFKSLVDKSDRLLTLNKGSFEFASKFNSNKALILPNFIEEEFAKKPFFVREEVRRIVYVGLVQFVKGFREIYRAAQYFSGIEFVLIGPVRDEVKEYGRLSNLKYMGEMEHDKIDEELRNSDIFLFPSYTEGFPNALLEAMAVGLPVVASDVGAIPDMVEDKGGVIVPAKDSKSVIRAINKMMDPQGRRKMSEWNQEKVLKMYSLPSVMKQLCTIYRETASQVEPVL